MTFIEFEKARIISYIYLFIKFLLLFNIINASLIDYSNLLDFNILQSRFLSQLGFHNQQQTLLYPLGWHIQLKILLGKTHWRKRQSYY